MHFTQVLKHRLGWCPNHQVPVARSSKINSRTYAIILIAALGLLVAAQYIPSHSSQDVAVWVFRVDDTGTRNFIERIPATEDATGTLSFSRAAEGSALPPGKYWLVIEHPGKEGMYGLTLDGAAVKSQFPDSENTGRKLFTVTGPGSLTGEDAYEALMAAYNGGMYMTGSTIPVGNGVTEREYTVTP